MMARKFQALQYFSSTLKKDNIKLVQEGNYSVEMGDDGIWNYFITSFGDSRENVILILYALSGNYLKGKMIS